jgi:protein O-mannosyl-transferase
MKKPLIQINLLDRLLSGKKPYGWLIGVILILYLPSLFFGFSYLDDNVLILDNLFFLKDLGNFFTTFVQEVFHISHASAAYYRPILTISFMLDAQISGAKPFFYHFSNVAIHVITTCLVYSFLKRLNFKKELAFLFSLIFAVHPVLAQAVAWVPGRNDSLLAMFTLATLISFFKYIEKPNMKNCLYQIGFFGLSLFTKESAIFIPVVCLFYLVVILRKKLFSSITIPLYVGWAFFYFVWFLLRTIALTEPIKYTATHIIRSFVFNSPAVLIYLGKILFPFNLSVIPIIEGTTLIFGVITLLAIVLLLIFSKEKNTRMILFGTLWFFAFLLPSFIRPNSNYVADFMEHRLYLPLIGVFIVLSEIDYLKKLNWQKTKVLIGSGMVVLILIVFNAFHLPIFKDSLSFWKNAVKYSYKHPLAHKNLGAMYYLAGNKDEAEKEYRISIGLNPVETMIHNNLGLIYMDRGEMDKAENEFKAELTINPGYDNAFFNYGLLEFYRKNYDKAEELWLTTLMVNPDKIEALKNLYIISAQKKEFNKAAYFQNELEKRGIPFP